MSKLYRILSVSVLSVFLSVVMIVPVRAEETITKNEGVTHNTSEDSLYYYYTIKDNDNNEYIYLRVDKMTFKVTILDTNFSEKDQEYIVSENMKIAGEIATLARSKSDWTYETTLTGNTLIQNKSNAAILAALSGLIAFASGIGGIIAASITGWLTTGVDTLYYTSKRYFRWEPNFQRKWITNFYSNEARTKLVKSSTTYKDFNMD